MPALLLIGHDAASGPAFNVEDPAGSGGRIDVLIRGLTAGLLTSHGIRREWEVELLLLGPPTAPKRVRFNGAKLRHLNPDERSTTILLKRILAEPVPGKLPVEAAPGVTVSREGLADIVAERAESPLYVLEESGADLLGEPLPREATFVLSDHRDPTVEERALLLKRGARPLGLGPVPLQVHQAIVVLENAWDRRHALPGWRGRGVTRGSRL